MWWALKRRIIYIGLFFIVILILSGPSVYKFISKEATCFDGKRNGKELGIDCGGACQEVCQSNVEKPIVLWSRSFEVRPGTYSSIAMIENPNGGIGAIDVPYTFKLFDSQNILVYERRGITDIPAQVRFPVFEGGIVTGERMPQRTFFELGSDVFWSKQDNLDLKLRTAEQKITGIDSSPKIEIKVENRDLKLVEDIELFVIVYDLVDNAIAGSRSFIDRIESDSSKTVTFTWPEPFGLPIGRIEVIPKFDIKR